MLLHHQHQTVYGELGIYRIVSGTGSRITHLSPKEAYAHVSHRGLLVPLPFLWKVNTYFTLCRTFSFAFMFSWFLNSRNFMHFILFSTLCQSIVGKKHFDYWVIICNSVLRCVWSPAVSVMCHLCQHILWNSESCWCISASTSKKNFHCTWLESQMENRPFVLNVK